MPRWSAERRDVPIARDVKTPHQRLRVPHQHARCLTGTCVSPCSTPPRSPASQKARGGKELNGYGAAGAAKPGRRSYVLFDNLIGSARLSSGSRVRAGGGYNAELMALRFEKPRSESALTNPPYEVTPRYAKAAIAAIAMSIATTMATQAVHPAAFQARPGRNAPTLPPT